MSEEKQAVVAAKLYSENETFSKIADSLGVSKSFSQELVRRGILSLLEDVEEAEIEELTPTVNSEVEPVEHQEAEALPIESQPVRSLYMEDRDIEDVLNTTMIKSALPLMRKIALNPKIYLLYDYSVNQLGFRGDIGDFVQDTVDFFFKENNIEIAITQRTEIPR